MQDKGFEEVRVRAWGHWHMCPALGKRILSVYPSPAAGVGPCVVGVWPRPLELGKCFRSEALGCAGRHGGLSRPLSSELRRSSGLGPESVYVTMRQVFC